MQDITWSGGKGRQVIYCLYPIIIENKFKADLFKGVIPESLFLVITGFILFSGFKIPRHFMNFSITFLNFP